jgi:hypothetical protein
MRSASRSTWFSLTATCLAIFVVIGGCGSDTPKAAPRPPKPPEDINMTAADFVNLHDMTPVRGFFVANKLGHLKQTLAIATANKGGKYPVGTIIQLVPQEAMVKRRAGFNPKTKDWEFFFLATDATGTTIDKRGGEEVVNRFGGNCAACHSAAQGKFDMVCEKTHGCAPLPIGDDVIHSVQEADPRPRATKS